MQSTPDPSRPAPRLAALLRAAAALGAVLLLLAPLGCGFFREPQPEPRRIRPRREAAPPQRALTSAERRAQWRRKQAESPTSSPASAEESPAAPQAPPEAAERAPSPVAPMVPLAAISTANRDEVVRLYREVYLPSLSAPINWTGDIERCDVGTVSPEYTEATRRMVNYFRTMAGVGGDVVFDPSLNAKCRAAALTFLATPGLSHYIPDGWACYSPAADEAARHSNIALGYAGPLAVVKYMEEPWSKNFDLTHRQWILYPPSRRMGSGSVGGRKGSYRGANALWVQPPRFDEKPGSARWISWPPRGYVPYPVVFGYWSVAPHVAGNVDYSDASVTMTRRGGGAISLRRGVSPSPYSPDAALAWMPEDLAFAPGMRDETFDVEVRNVRIAGAPRSVRYAVTVIDPASAAPRS